MASADGHAAVDAEHVAGHEAAAGAQQVQHGGLVLAGAPAAPVRRDLEQEVGVLIGVVEELGVHLGR
jgi:hypothetical protein